MPKPRTLFEKVWDAHRVRELPGGQVQHFVGLHLVHEVKSPQAFAMLRDAVIPRLEYALDDTRDAYRAGRYSYLELIAARQELINARLALVNAARRAHLNRIELERLAGAELSATAGDSEEEEHEESEHDH